jgi:hypothetical protein
MLGLWNRGSCRGRTEQSCRGWRRRHSTGALGTSLGRRTRRRQRHRRYHLIEDGVSGIAASGHDPYPATYILSFSSRSEAQRTDGGRLDHVADGESLYGLVLGCASRAVGASDGLDMTATLLVTSVGRALLDHVCGCVGGVRRRVFE